MEYYQKLPRNKKEFALFMFIISIISVNIIAPLITCFETEFSLASWANVLKIIPLMWVCVVALVLLTYKPAQWMTGKILKQEDSFNAHMIINALCTVFMLSILLTVVGTWVGTRHISLEPITMFFYKWPRNFAIALGIELIIAQPFARFIMSKIHQVKDSHNNDSDTTNTGNEAYTS